MQFKSLMIGAVAAVLASGSAFADSRMISRPATPDLPDMAGKAPIIRVQDNNSVMEEIRRLNGRVEELNFQILQMQTQIQKMQEDNEFRFQQLEGGGGSSGSKPAETPKKPQKQGSLDKPAEAGPSTDTAATDQSMNSDASVGAAESGSTVASNEGNGTALPPPAQPGDEVGDVIAKNGTTDVKPGGKGLQPKEMGSITFDENGNVVGGTVGDQAVVDPDPNGATQQDGADNTVVASLPKTDDPDILYRQSYDFLLSGQNATAEAGFADHIKRFPKDSRTADARFWLGEAQLGQRKYRDAAETFLAASKAYPKARKAPDMLLKLGVALVGLNQKSVACATFDAVGTRYPDASKQVRERVKQEQANAAC